MAHEMTEVVTVFDETRSLVVNVGQQGISDDDLPTVREWIANMLEGTTDTLTLLPEESLEVDEDLNLLVYRQFDDIMKEADFVVSLAVVGKGKVSTGLHIDTRSTTSGELITQSGLRINFNDGKNRGSNIPDGIDPRQYDPIFLFGRIGQQDTSHGSAFRSYDGFQPSVAVEMTKPVWNIFRSIGNPEGSNPPVVHSVIPRKLLDKVIDADAEFSAMVADPELSQPGTTIHSQKMTLDGETIVMSTEGSPYYGPYGKLLGPNRDTRAVDYLHRDVDFMEI